MSNSIRLAEGSQVNPTLAAIMELSSVSSAALDLDLTSGGLLTREGSERLAALMQSVEQAFPGFSCQASAPMNAAVLGLQLAAHIASKLDPVSEAPPGVVAELSAFIRDLSQYVQNLEGLRIKPTGNDLPLIRGPRGDLYALASATSPNTEVIPQESCYTLRKADGGQFPPKGNHSSQIFIDSKTLKLPEAGSPGAELMVDKRFLPAFELAPDGGGGHTLQPCVVNLNSGDLLRVEQDNLLYSQPRVIRYDCLQDRFIVAWVIDEKQSPADRKEVGILCTIDLKIGKILPCECGSGFVCGASVPEIIRTAAGDVIVLTNPILGSQKPVWVALYKPTEKSVRKLLEGPIGLLARIGYIGPTLLPGSRTFIAFGVVGERCECKFVIYDAVRHCKWSIGDCRSSDIVPEKVQHVLIDGKRGTERSSTGVNSIILFGKGRDKDGNKIYFEADPSCGTIKDVPYQVLGLFPQNDITGDGIPAKTLWRGSEMECTVTRVDSKVGDRCQALVESTEGVKYLVTL